MTISEVYAAFETQYLLNNNRSQKTITEYRGRLFGRSGLTTVIGDIPLDFLGLDHIIRWKLYLRDEGLQAGYINDCLSSARWVLKWAGEHEFRVLDWRLIEMEKEETNKPKEVLTPEEIQRLMDCAPTLRDKAIIKLFFGTGIRSKEELEIDRPEWESAVLTNKANVEAGIEPPVWEISVLGKNKKYRPICFYQDTKDMVDAYLESRADHYRPLFVSQQNRRISYSMVSRMLHRTAARAGLTKRVTQHVFRHSFTTDQAANGMPIPIISAQLGHANTAITMKIYTHINQPQVRNAFAEYAQKRGTQTAKALTK